MAFTLHPYQPFDHPPPLVPQGHQTDGGGDHYLAVALTPEGHIPGKAKGNTCWYPYGGKEHTTNNFSWVVVPNFLFLRNNGGTPPANGVPCGYQNDGSGQLWGALAHTTHGDIPGKAKANTCWYAYAGEEQTTNNFSYIIQKWAVLSLNLFPNPPPSVVTGQQNDETGIIYLAVANTPWGKIAAKAKGNTAWYPYGGKEHTTNSFEWLSVPGASFIKNKGQMPPNTVVVGVQNDGNSPYGAVLASTPYGTIPAKAHGNSCWYPYGGKVHTTNDFSWIVHV